MMIKTRIFQLCDGKFRNLSELAGAMGLSVSQVYRVREGKRSINQKFLVGAKRAFPEYRLDDLFYLDAEASLNDEVVSSAAGRYQYVVAQCKKY